MSDEKLVLHEKRGRALWITINRPDKRNALNASVIAGIADGYRRAHDDDDVRAIVLTGAGVKAFCAGMDLQPGGGFAYDLSRPNLAIARVNGVCMAGGMGLLCMADMAVSAEDAIFGLPEVKVGVYPMQVLSLLQSMAPQRVVREWCITGEPFSAAEAKEAGLLNYTVSAADLDAKVEWLIARISDKSPTAIRRGKYATRMLASMSFDQAIAYAEAQIATLSMTQDAKEGMAAFVEKRKPVWTGK